MICPMVAKEMYFYSGVNGYKPNDDETDRCAKEFCAWYDGKQCAILSITEALKSIANSISNGVKKT